MTTPTCPEDHQPLAPSDPDDHGGHRCARCAGAWLTRLQIEGIARARSLEATILLAALTQNDEGTTTLTCPQDGRALNRARIEDVELDFCRDCSGVWVNHGELDKVLSREPFKRARPHQGALVAVDAVGVLFALLSS